MNGDYKLVVDGACLPVILTARNPHKARLLHFLEMLASDPYQLGDCQLRSPNDRTYEIRFLRPFRIIYYADHAVKELRVVGIEIQKL